MENFKAKKRDSIGLLKRLNAIKMYSVVATGRNSLTTHRIAEGLHVYPWSYFNNDKIAGNKRGINIQFCPVNRLKKSQNIR